MVKEILKFKYYILAFVFFEIIIVSGLMVIRENRVGQYMDSQQKLLEVEYNTLYSSYKRLSDNTFNLLVNKDNIINLFKDAKSASKEKQKEIRNKMALILHKDYKFLVRQNYKQLHFHLPNNDSFLRMHKVSKYGDNLSDIRYSVKYTNDSLKPIDGLEMGRIVHGFRFVYPMFDRQNNHIGSVETSISPTFFKEELQRQLNSNVHFIINKDSVDNKVFDAYKNNYRVSSESDDFYYCKNAKEANHFHNPSEYLNSKTKKLMAEKLKTNKTFSLYFKDKENRKIVTFLPIKNIKEQKVIAYFVIYQDANFLNDLYNMSYLATLFGTLFNIIVLFSMYRVYREIEKNRNKDLLLAHDSKLTSMSEMIGNIAHQWRQPLSAISSSASGAILEQELGLLDDKTINRTLNTIINNTKYLSNTINDFQDFFGDCKDLTDFDLEIFINDTLLIYTSLFTKNKIQVKSDINDIKLHMCKNKLKQVLVNIINNSKDAIDENGIIYISTKVIKEEVLISIKDSGGGVEENIINKLFEPYYTTKHQEQGKGLGLYIVYQLVSEHLKGSIRIKNTYVEVEGKEKKGLEVAITIPIEQKNS